MTGCPWSRPPLSPVIRRARPDELDAVGRLTVDAYVRSGVISADETLPGVPR